MKTIIVAGCLALASIAAAVAQPAPPDSFTLRVDSKDIEVIGEGLGSLPYTKVAPLMGKLQSQIKEQIEMRDKILQKQKAAPTPKEPANKE